VRGAYTRARRLISRFPKKTCYARQLPVRYQNSIPSPDSNNGVVTGDCYGGVPDELDRGGYPVNSNPPQVNGHQNVKISSARRRSPICASLSSHSVSTDSCCLPWRCFPGQSMLDLMKWDWTSSWCPLSPPYVRRAR